MLKFLRSFFTNLRAFGRFDIQQMIDFENELMEQHNALVEDIKAINMVLRREVGYDAGRFLRPRPGHIDLMQKQIAPLTIPLEIATEVEAFLVADDAERVARVKAALNKAPLDPPVAARVRKAVRRRKRTR